VSSKNHRVQVVVMHSQMSDRSVLIFSRRILPWKPPHFLSIYWTSIQVSSRDVSCERSSVGLRRGSHSREKRYSFHRCIIQMSERNSALPRCAPPSKAKILIVVVVNSSYRSTHLNSRLRCSNQVFKFFRIYYCYTGKINLAEYIEMFIVSYYAIRPTSYC